MKIKLLQPLPQIGRVIPAGVYIDAPFSLKDRLVKQGKAIWEFDEENDRGDGETAVPVSPVTAQEKQESETPAKSDKPVSQRKKGGRRTDA